MLLTFLRIVSSIGVVEVLAILALAVGCPIELRKAKRRLMGT